jgi:signal transduction histidine kinase
MNSIRARLALISAVVIALVLAIAGFGQILLFEKQLDRQLAQALEVRLLDVAGAIQQSPEGLAMSRDPVDPRYRNPYGGAYWYVRQADKVLLRSRSLWDDDIGVLQGDPLKGVVRARGPADSSVHVYERPIIQEGTDEGFVIGVAIDASETEEQMSAFRSQTIKSLALIGLVLFAGAWLQASYGLSPLARIRTQLTRMHQGDADKLSGPFPAEIDELANDLNRLFRSQKEMIDKAREHAGALAHGIKTPMTVLFGELRKFEREDSTASVSQMREQLDLISRHVDRVLSRARARGTTAGIGTHADFSETAARLAGLMQRMPRGAELDWRLPYPGITVAMDADDLGEVLGNLMDNARKFAHSSITVSAETASIGKLRVAVIDDGPGLSENNILIASENIRDSSGLGLKIASDVVAAYGSCLEVEREAVDGLKVQFVVGGSIA